MKRTCKRIFRRPTMIQLVSLPQKVGHRQSVPRTLPLLGITVPIAKLCRWFNVPRRTVYSKAVKASPKPIGW